MILLALAACSRPGPPNILLVSFDTVRADRSSVYGAPRDTTPNLARLAAEGVVFETSISQGNESAYSHATLFTGRYPSEIAAPVYETYAVPSDATLLPEILRLYDYETAAFVAGGHVSEGFGFDQGYDLYQSEIGFASFYDTVPKAEAWLEARTGEKPWFVFLHSYDTHRPYTKPGPWSHLYAKGQGSRVAEQIVAMSNLSELVVDGHYFPQLQPNYFRHPSGEMILDPGTYDWIRNRIKDTDSLTVTDADKQHVRDHYDATLAYGDLLLGDFLASMEDAGKLDNTIVIVLSDHGEDLLDHGFMNHRTGLYDSCTHVPTIIAGPGFPKGSRVSGLIEARDIATTVLAAAGATIPAGLGGRDLRAVAAGTAPAIDVVFSEGVMDMISARTATHKLVYHHAPLNTPGYADTLAAAALDDTHFTLYDLVADPTEQVNILAKDPTTAASLRDRMVAWRRTLTMGTHQLPQDQVDPAVADQMRKNGYWEAGANETPH